MNWVFLFFFVSGFCSILYELVWLRLAMAKFGVTTALVSIVLSVFMAGLGAGSWIAGALVRRYGTRIRFPPLRLYALAELLIGISAVGRAAAIGVGKPPPRKAWRTALRFRRVRITCFPARGWR